MLTHNDLHPVRIDSESLSSQERDRLYARIQKASPQAKELLYASSTIELLSTVTGRFSLKDEEARTLTRLVRDTLLSNPSATQFYGKLASKIKSPHTQHIGDILTKHLAPVLSSSPTHQIDQRNVLDLRNT